MPARKQKEPSVLEKALQEGETPHLGTLQTVRVNLYEIIHRQVEDGVGWGLRRHWKHREGRPEDVEMEEMRDTVASHVMAALCEVVEFNEE